MENDILEFKKRLHLDKSAPNELFKAYKEQFKKLLRISNSKHLDNYLIERIKFYTPESVFIPLADLFIDNLHDILKIPGVKKLCLGTDLRNDEKGINGLFYEFIKRSFEGNKKVEVIKYDPDGNMSAFTEKFDLILGLLYFDARRSDNFNFFLFRLKAGGALISHSTAAFNFMLSAKSVKNSRELTLERNILSSVYILPEKELFPFTSAKTYITEIINSVKDEYEIVLGRLEEEGETFKATDLKKIPKKKLLEENTGTLQMLFTGNSEIIKSYIKSGIKTVKLSEIADIISGKALYPKNADKGKVGDKIYLINVGSIGEYGIFARGEELKPFRDDKTKHEKLFIRNDDIITASRGTRIKSCIITENDIAGRNILPVFGVIVIRIKEAHRGKIPPQALLAFLNSETGMEYLKMLQRGGTLLNISINDISKITVPSEFGGKLGRKIEELQSTVIALKETESRLKELYADIDKIFRGE